MYHALGLWHYWHRVDKKAKPALALLAFLL